MKNIKILVFSFMLLSVWGCGGDCPITENEPPFVCAVRDVTITQFNPGLRDSLMKTPDGRDSTSLVPVPEYSIHTYQFPANNSSTGDLPNDNRFIGAARIPIATEPLEKGSQYSAAILDLFPLNVDITGDIMAVNLTITANSGDNTADIRVYGSIARMPIDFYSENSQEFCEYVKKYTTKELNDIRVQSSKFGYALPNSKIADYKDSTVEVIDAKGKIVTGQGGIPPVSSDVKTALFDKVKNAGIDITVKPGEVYFYKARNGKEFVFVVADINKGSFYPNKKRLTIMFNPLG